MSATVKYNGARVVTIANGQSTVLECKGIKMKSDVEIECKGGEDSYQEGYTNGYNQCTEEMGGQLEAKYTEGYNKCTEDMQDDLQSKYNEGYSKCEADMADDLEAKYNEGYSAGVEAGKAQGGSSDTYGVEEMLTRFPFLRKVEFVEAPEEVNPLFAQGMSGAIVSSLYDGATSYFSYVVIPPWITEVTEGAICYGGADGGGTDAVIFLPKTPPVIDFQGMWADDGGQTPPKAIFVPDESIEEYKVASNLAPYAHLIKPLSEYNGEGYYGGLM